MDQISSFYQLVASYIKQEWISRVPQLVYVKKYLENAVDYKGRSNRPEFWWPALFNVIIALAFQILFAIFVRIGFLYRLVNFVSFLYTLFCLLPNITLGIRRLHDINQPGWFLLLPFAGLIAEIILASIGSVIPVIGGLFIFVAAVLPALTILALVFLFAQKTR